MDQYEVRTWRCLAPVRHPLPGGARLLVVAAGAVRTEAVGEEKRGWRIRADPDHRAGDAPAGAGAAANPMERRAFRLGWSRWRRAHQAVAARCHAARHARARATRRLIARSLPAAPIARCADRGRVGARPTAACRRSDRGRGGRRHDHRTDPRRDPDAWCTGSLVARDAGGVRQVGDGVPAVPALVRQRPLAAHPRGTAERGMRSVAVGTSQGVDKPRLPLTRSAVPRQSPPASSLFDGFTESQRRSSPPASANRLRILPESLLID